MRTESRAGTATGGRFRAPSRTRVLRVAGVLTLVATLAIGVLLSGAFRGSEETVANRAKASFESGEFEEAAVAAQEAVDHGYADAEVYAVLGWAREALGSLEEAEAAYVGSLELDSEQPRIRHALAMLLLHRGDVPGAERELRAALEANPDLVGSRLALADVLMQGSKPAEAKEQYMMVLEAAPIGVDLDSVRLKMESLP